MLKFTIRPLSQAPRGQNRICMCGDAAQRAIFLATQDGAALQFVACQTCTNGWCNSILRSNSASIKLLGTP